MIIFADEDTLRTKQFLKSLAPPIRTMVKTCKTIEECTDILVKQEEDIYLLFVGGPMGSAQFIESIVAWIIAKQPPIRQIVVHAEGKLFSNNIVQILDHAQYRVRHVPFTQVIKNLQKGNL